jgi:2-phosphosulfolactate phosphatase
MAPFSQGSWACRCEWGAPGAAALSPADVTIVVDVFSFTTCVDVATSRGAAILPYAWDDPSAAEFARIQGAELAGRRREARYSLAPESYLDAAAGLRCVLPSPNGAQVTLAAAGTAPVILAGSLRNARAVAEAAARTGSAFNVIPAGERWRDGSLRPALEDWLGAGAILRWLPGSHSPEADSAVALFDRHRDRLVATLDQCGSGRELEDRGRRNDKEIAEMPAKDAAVSADFYARIFGWNVRTRGDGARAFDDATGAVSGTWVPPSERAAMMTYIMVDSIKDTQARIVAAGGQVVTPSTPIGQGPSAFAVFRDPAGNQLGLYQEK